MTKKPKMIGSINCYAVSHAWVGKRQFIFDGTTLGLARVMVKNGIHPGTIVKANYGGRTKADARDVMVVAAPHDDRASGIWISDIREKV